MSNKLNIWFPTVCTKSGSDIYTIRLCEALKNIGVNAKITWFSHIYEVAPFFMGKKKPPINTNIIHANSWNAFAFKRQNIPLVSTLHHNVHEPAFTCYKSKVQNTYHHLIWHYEKLSFNKASINIAVSHYTANSYKQTFDFNNTQTIHNWLNTEQFHPSPRKTKHNPFKLLFIGNLSRRKGADLLPQIMSRLGKGYELHSTGGIRADYEMYGKNSALINHGYISKTSDLIKLYQSCDALLFPSRLEGFGLAALEAQACGLPVIATNSTAFPEVILDKETGLLCQEDNIDDFVSAIHELQSNPNETKKMGIKARAHVINTFSEKHILPKYISMYESLLVKSSF